MEDDTDESESLIVSSINLDINWEQKTVIPIYLNLRSETCFHVYIFVSCVGDWKTKNRDEVKKNEVWECDGWVSELVQY